MKPSPAYWMDILKYRYDVFLAVPHACVSLEKGVVAESASCWQLLLHSITYSFTHVHVRVVYVHTRATSKNRICTHTRYIQRIIHEDKEFDYSCPICKITANKRFMVLMPTVLVISLQRFHTRLPNDKKRQRKNLMYGTRY